MLVLSMWVIARLLDVMLHQLLLKEVLESLDEPFCLTIGSLMVRHTSKLESFNSMMLKYAPKRVAF
ncbi:hypothetical protein QZH41_012085, partial [Actinostola sp. cb2023]